MARLARVEGGGSDAAGSRSREPPRLALAGTPLAAGLLALAVLGAAAALRDAPPPAVPRDAPPDQFSAGRAMDHVRALARAPRPVGSTGNAAGREYIVERLRSLGLEPELQDAESAVSVLGRTYSARVTNVLARIRGAAPRPALALVAHHDTVPHSPGASDDAAGVATLLETARALRAGPALRHDVILLFTDGEELGLLGARAFVREHAWSRDVATALNFDARGSRGVSAMYDTSHPNRRVVELFARAAPAPFASSAIAVLARILPNDTDLTVFKAAGADGLGFAYADGLEDYHRVTDAPDNIDAGSLQHHGSYALSLARALSREQGAAPPRGELVYFDVLRRWLVSYPARCPAWIGAVLAAGYAALVIAARQRGLVRGRRVPAGALAALGAAAAAAIAATAWAALLSLWLRPEQRVAEAGAIALACACLAVLASALAHGIALRRATELEVQLGALGAWAALALVLGALAPAASHVVQWPLLFALGGVSFALSGRGPVATAAVLCASLAPAVLVLVPFVHVVLVTVGAQDPAVVGAAIAFATSLLAPWTASAWLPRRGAISAALSALALGAAAAALAAPPSRVPSSSSLTLAVDADAHRARWLTPERRPGPWLRGAAGEPVGREPPARFRPEGEAWSWSDAPPVDLPAPEVRVSYGAIVRGARAVTLVARSLRGARCLSAWQTAGPAIAAARVNGAAPAAWVRFSPEVDRRLWTLVTGQRLYGGWNLEHCGAPGEPVAIELALPPGAHADLRVADSSDGLSLPVPPRPAGVLPGYDGDRTIVSRGIALDAPP
jgi:hypothetical protein